MLTTAIFISVLVEVTHVLLVVQHNQIKIDLLLSVSVLRLEAVCAAVIILGVVNDEGGDGAALVLVGANGELLAVCELAVQRVPPGEHWGRLSPAPDLPEGGPPGADCLGAGLALVDGRGEVLVSAEVGFGLG